MPRARSDDSPTRRLGRLEGNAFLFGRRFWGRFAAAGRGHDLQVRIHRSSNGRLFLVATDETEGEDQDQAEQSNAACHRKPRGLEKAYSKNSYSKSTTTPSPIPPRAARM